MDAELKAKWLAALRSGEYQQTSLVLRDDDGFCCLGVLCDVMDNSKWEYNTRTDQYMYSFEVINGQTFNDGQVIPPLFQAPLGLEVMIGDDDDSQELTNILMDMNDEKGKTFAEIADYIETVL